MNMFSLLPTDSYIFLFPFNVLDPSYSCCPLVDESKDKKAKEDLRSMVPIKQDADAVICNVISKLYAEVYFIS